MKIVDTNAGVVNYDLGIFGVIGDTPDAALVGTAGITGPNGDGGTCCSGGGIAGDNGKPGAKVVMAVKVTPELKEMTDYPL